MVSETDDSIANNSGDTLVRGQLFPSDICGSTANSSGLGCCTKTFEGSLRMDDGTAYRGSGGFGSPTTVFQCCFK
jgi:hypothetical protein